MDASGNGRMFGHEPQVRTGGRGQHAGANVHCMHRCEGTDSMLEPTSTACADTRVRTGERGRHCVRLIGTFAKTSAKSCDHLQQSYTIECIPENLIYHILYLKIMALHVEVTRKFYL
jgi:hypothetical protein